MPQQMAALFVVGALAGIIGSLVGLGGGFLAVPILRMAFSLAPANVAGAALVMVAANALSGSTAYLQQRRVDIRTGLLAAITGIPASIFGAVLVRRISVIGFDLLYGALLIYLSIDIIRRRNQPASAPRHRAQGTHGRPAHDAVIVCAGLFMGFASSFFGIGGGLIMVPALMFLNMPVHIVTATSSFAILLTSPVGVITHEIAHDIDWHLAFPLALGGLLGGQIGPRIALRLTSPQLLTIMAITLMGAAIALVARHLTV